MPYNFDNFQSQLADLSRQYQQLQNQSQPDEKMIDEAKEAKVLQMMYKGQ